MNFEKIAGYENEKKELLSLREMLHNADKFKEKGIRIPRGAALYGEPGIGKTVLARAIADEGIALIELRAADCCSDDTESAIRLAFEHAKENAPSVLLLDELDKIAGTSMNFFMEGNDDVKKILLQELDRLTSDDVVLVVATCNDTECLGEALLRSGRFDRLIGMSAPDEDTRKKILEQYFNGLDIKQEFDIDYVARITTGYTGAKLECLVNEAGIMAMDQNKDCITEEDIRLVMNKLSFNGSERKPTKDQDALKRTAIHEAGHALVALYTRPENLYGASILPQGESGGHIHFIGCYENAPSISQVEEEIEVLLAGRVAERTILKDFCLGAENDLRQAAGKMMYLISNQAAYGYKFLLNSIGGRGMADFMSESVKEATAQLIDEKLTELDTTAQSIIENHRETFDKIVAALLEKQVLSREELLSLAGLKALENA